MHKLGPLTLEWGRVDYGHWRLVNQFGGVHATLKRNVDDFWEGRLTDEFSTVLLYKDLEEGTTFLLDLFKAKKQEEWDAQNLEHERRRWQR